MTFAFQYHNEELTCHIMSVELSTNQTTHHSLFLSVQVHIVRWKHTIKCLVASRAYLFVCVSSTYKQSSKLCKHLLTSNQSNYHQLTINQSKYHLLTINQSHDHLAAVKSTDKQSNKLGNHLLTSMAGYQSNYVIIYLQAINQIIIYWQSSNYHLQAQALNQMIIWLRYNHLTGNQNKFGTNHLLTSMTGASIKICNHLLTSNQSNYHLLKSKQSKYLLTSNQSNQVINILTSNQSNYVILYWQANQ